MDHDQDEQRVAKSTAEQDDATGAPATGQDVEQLEHDLRAARDKADALTQQVQRSLADYANLKKRFEKERSELLQFAAQALMLELLPAIDNLERAVVYASESDQQSSIFTGVKMTLQQLDGVLSQTGFRKITVDPGQSFDPHLHEAIEMVAGKKDTIVQVLDQGYMLHDKVVRPARVKVGSDVADG
jgi:molecular chaperone GrpE